MKLQAFQALVRRLADEVPPDYLDGIAAIDVSPRTVPHAVREDTYTLGECVPVHADGADVTSRVVLYHGSFAALARESEGFRWRDEAWETLLHELRHHLEWRANTDALEAYDWAAEQNFNRQDGAPFDPLFYQAGERLDDGAYRVDDDVFLERVARHPAEAAEIVWRGRRYHVVPPVDAALPVYLILEGVADPPDGDLIVVLRRRPRLWDILRRMPAPEECRVGVRAAG